MTEKDGTPTFHARSRQEWREWLAANHATEQRLWLIIFKKQSGVPTVTYDEAVDEALCFGWIDSTINKRDDDSFFQFFAKRKPNSNWSKVNKAKVAKLIEAGLMMPAGLESIAIAKANGCWTALDGVEALEVPADLQAAFDQNPTAWHHFEAFSRSSKRAILEWLLNAKRPETRQKRIDEIVTAAAQNIKANQPKERVKNKL